MPDISSERVKPRSGENAKEAIGLDSIGGLAGFSAGLSELSKLKGSELPPGFPSASSLLNTSELPGSKSHPSEVRPDSDGRNPKNLPDSFHRSRDGDDFKAPPEKLSCESEKMPEMTDEQDRANRGKLTEHGLAANDLWRRSDSGDHSIDYGPPRDQNYKGMKDVLSKYPTEQIPGVLEHLNKQLQDNGAKARLRYDENTKRVWYLKDGVGRYGDLLMQRVDECALTS